MNWTHAYAPPTLLPGLPFTCDAAFLRQMKLLNLTTAFGDLDLSFEPAGTRGYEELEPRSVRYDLGKGLVVPVAALEDIIRSDGKDERSYSALSASLGSTPAALRAGR